MRETTDTLVKKCNSSDTVGLLLSNHQFGVVLKNLNQHFIEKQARKFIYLRLFNVSTPGFRQLHETTPVLIFEFEETTR
ncbi:hypothetical protein ACFL0M_02780 [Thermodesulfobacteriota bacterium]